MTTMITNELWKKTLTDNYNFLLKNLPVDAMLPMLVSKKVITWEQKNNIRSKLSLHEKNEALLDILIEIDPSLRVHFLFACFSTGSELITRLFQSEGLVLPHIMSELEKEYMQNCHQQLGQEFHKEYVNPGGELKAENHELKKQINLLKVKNDKLEHKVNKLQAEGERKAKSMEYPTDTTEIQKQVAQIRLEVQNEALEAENTKLRKRVAQLLAEMEAIKIELQTLQSENYRLDAEIKEYRSLMEQAEEIYQP